jgi:hypothetical protein
MKQENEETESIVEDFTRRFVEEYPESNKPYQPRKLQHLSRCKIRSCLSLSSNLPHGVKSLGLTKVMEKYVLFEA